jgi:L-histidine N-alpha-methyltransferase
MQSGQALEETPRPDESSRRVTLEVHVRPGEFQRSLCQEVLAGLCQGTGLKELSPKWLYDERGSQLFDEITQLDEYYPTRRELEILTAHAGDIARASGADTLLELGSGSSKKTRLLLDAMSATEQLKRFIPFDVSQDFLLQAAEKVAAEYPGLHVHAVVGDFGKHLGRLPRGGRRLVAFLGGTIGNLKPQEREHFYATLAEGLAPGEGLLLGADLIKCRKRLFAAYNDEAGVTADFNRNMLRVLNRELGADFEPEAFEHLAPFDEENEWIEMRLISTKAQTVRLAALGREVHFAPGEVLRTEVSCKFSPERVERELAAAGLVLTERWTDAAGDFALSLALKR